MRKRAYPEYKPSGIKWLGEIPAHWRITPVKYVGRFYTGWTPPTGRDEFFIGDHLWANISDLGPRVLRDTAKRISDEAINTSRLKLSPKGSLLFSFKLSIGQVSIAGVDMYTNEAIATFPPSNGTDVAYLYWAAPFFIPHNADENIYGAKLLNQDLIKNARMAIPPEDEQRAIAAFLDRETARIDALIGKKEQQIELLQEKRIAVISHAVTKGLDPNVKMKDSGVEWLEEIPEHWETCPLKYTASFINGAAFKPSDWQDDGIPIIRIENLNGGEEFNYYDGELPEKYHVWRGDLLFGWSGNRGTSFGPFLWWRDGLHYLNQHIFKITHYRCDKMWLYWTLTGVTFYVEKQAHGIIGLVHITKGDLGAIKIPVLSLEEQRRIAEHIHRQTARIDTMVERIRKSIDLLREYRTALISAAVTGKVDVRKEVA